MEQRQAHAALLARRDDLLLRAIERPVGAHAARILGGIGIADHHFLMSVDPVAVPRDREQVAHDGACMLEIARRLEERHDALRVRGARRHLEKLDSEHV